MTSVLAPPVNLLTPPPKLAAASPADRAKVDKVARDYEASFLSVMFGQMFEGVDASPPFGGGEGEAAFKSFLTDAMAKSVARHGGIGLAKPLAHEILKLQGLS